MALVTTTVEIHEVNWDRVKETTYLVVTNNIRSRQRLVNLSLTLPDGTQHSIGVKAQELAAALENAMNPNNLDGLSNECGE